MPEDRKEQGIKTNLPVHRCKRCMKLVSGIELPPKPWPIYVEQKPPNPIPLPKGQEGFLCPDCGTRMENSPDGPWCPKCDPDAPRRFHVEECGPFPEAEPIDDLHDPRNGAGYYPGMEEEAEGDRHSNEEDEAHEEELDRQKDEHASRTG